MKTWIVPIIEVREVKVEYFVEAETMDESIRLAENGETVEEKDFYHICKYEVVGRNFDLSREIEEEKND